MASSRDSRGRPQGDALIIAPGTRAVPTRRPAAVAVAEAPYYDCVHSGGGDGPRKPSFWSRFSTAATIVFLTLIVMFMGYSAYAFLNPPCPTCELPEQTEKERLLEDYECFERNRGFCVAVGGQEDGIALARHYLRRGDAESAAGRVEDGLFFYRLAILAGRSHGAQSAVQAARRVHLQSLTCPVTAESLARITDGFPSGDWRGPITVAQKKSSLTALGYPAGRIDDVHDATLRLAVSAFQDDLGEEVTGALTPFQTVALVCGGAEVANDMRSQETLGIMYAVGLGVPRRTESAITWLETAAKRGSPDAAWNLALLYGTGTVTNSVVACGAVENARRADSYLEVAYEGGHLAAARIAETPAYIGLSAEDRWQAIKDDIRVPPPLTDPQAACALGT